MNYIYTKLLIVANSNKSNMYIYSGMSVFIPNVPTSPRSSTQRLTLDIAHRYLVMEGSHVK